MIQHLTVCTLIVSKICHNVEFIIAISNNPKPHLKIGPPFPTSSPLKKNLQVLLPRPPSHHLARKGRGVETCTNTHPDVRNVKVYWIYWIIRNNNSEYLKNWTWLFHEIKKIINLCLRWLHFNPFHATDLFWYPLKTSENLWYSDVFRGY